MFCLIKKIMLPTGTPCIFQHDIFVATLRALSFFDFRKAAKTVDLGPLMAPPGYALGTAKQMVCNMEGFKNGCACKTQFLTHVECIFYALTNFSHHNFSKKCFLHIFTTRLSNACRMHFLSFLCNWRLLTCLTQDTKSASLLMRIRQM